MAIDILNHITLLHLISNWCAHAIFVVSTGVSVDSRIKINEARNNAFLFVRIFQIEPTLTGIKIKKSWFIFRIIFVGAFSLSSVNT